MRICLLEKEQYPAFKALFCDYYAELDCEDEPLHLLDEYVLPDYEAGLLHIALCIDQSAVGFAIFQTDDPVNDWCFKDGWGDIREIYVVPSARAKGIGRALLAFAEKALKTEQACGLYALPTEDSEEFFKAAGYADGGEYCAELDNKVFIKKL